MEKILFITGASIFGLLGLLHLIYTFFSKKFDPYNLAVKEAMLNTSPRITKQTNMWQAWVGFNASHSLGAIFFAAFFIPLCINHFDVVAGSLWFSILPSVVGVSYLLLAKKDWFKVPFTGILVSSACLIRVAWSVTRNKAQQGSKYDV
ncbi:hypothetical protein L1285_17280 [Pseudoalteromonas sp. DL2-H2.2]|uniref:LIC_13387 family protein n=1 Tax=Pseudoalteromonas sp. DL2-H2.2 TaxID=2908889 RepID=UPI001F1CB12B|nr:hypothetical protein [Pseudoalteromonas sp. DL2-H2.2]MCF2910069.1 hypothetical protein [Pseudoalteromonas sp. DL2-H2.2]